MIKKLTLILLLTFSLTMIFSINTYAQSYDSEVLDGFINEITDNLDDEVTDLLEDFGLTEYTSDEIMSLSFESAINVIFGMFLNSISDISVFICINVGIIILISFSSSLISENSALKEYFESIAVVFITFFSLTNVIKIITGSLAVIKSVGGLMKLLIPILAAIVAATGNPSLAISSSSVSVYVSEVIIAICDDFLAPFLTILTSVAVCGSVYSGFDIASIMMFIKKVLTTVLGLLGTVYSGVLSIRDSIAAASDKVTVKGIQYILGSSVPVVGGTLSDGLSAGIAAVSLFKTTFGIFGIIVAFAITLPVFIQLLAWIFALFACEFLAKSMKNEKSGAVFESLRYVMTMIVSILIFTLFVFLISVSTVLVISKGV